MDEVAHDPVGRRPIVAAVDPIVVRAQAHVLRVLQATRGAPAHTPTLANAPWPAYWTLVHRRRRRWMLGELGQGPMVGVDALA